MTPPARCSAPFGALVLTVLAACAEAPGDARGDQPNILIIVADDLARSALGAYGGRDDLSPHIDRLAAESVLFEHALASSPFCTPSRQSFLTGRWPHAIGVTQVNSNLPPGAPTMGHAFRAAGYETAAFGKMHWHRRRFPEEDRGFDLITDVDDWLAQLPPEQAALYDDHREIWREHEEPGWSQLNIEGAPVPLPEEQQYAAFLVDRTSAFLERDRNRPFLAFCSFNEVHAPFNFPPSFADRVRPEDIVLPEAPRGELKRNAPGIHAHYRSQMRLKGRVNEADLRGTIASYLRSVAWLDSQVGRLLARLEETGLAEGTIVVFWSDHGYLLGEHGLTSKNQPFREVVEAPLLLRVPGVAPARRSALVQMLDLFPTLCELASVPPPADLDGVSIAPLLRTDEPLREFAYSEFAGLWSAVRDERWKLVIGRSADTGVDQLYDLENDPRERTNLVGDPERGPVVRALISRLHAWLAATPPDWLAPENWMDEPRPLDAVRAATALTEPRGWWRDRGEREEG